MSRRWAFKRVQEGYATAKHFPNNDVIRLQDNKALSIP